MEITLDHSLISVLFAGGVFLLAFMAFFVTLFKFMLEKMLDSKLDKKTQSLKDNQKHLENVFKEKHAESKMNIINIEVALKRENEKIKEIKTHLQKLLNHVEGLTNHVGKLTDRIIKDKSPGK